MGDLLFILVLYFIGRYIKSVTKILKEQKGGTAAKGKSSPVNMPKARPNKAQKHSRKDRKAEPANMATAAKPAKVARVSEPMRASRTVEPTKATANVQEDYFSFVSEEDNYTKPVRKTVEKKPQVASTSRAAKLFSPKGLAGAVVMSEILDKPLALREEYK